MKQMAADRSDLSLRKCKSKTATKIRIKKAPGNEPGLLKPSRWKLISGWDGDRTSRSTHGTSTSNDTVNQAADKSAPRAATVTTSRVIATAVAFDVFAA
jgi:hypothetical protein